MSEKWDCNSVSKEEDSDLFELLREYMKHTIRLGRIEYKVDNIEDGYIYYRTRNI